MKYPIPVEAACGSRSGGTYRLEKIYEFDFVPIAGDRHMWELPEGCFFMVKRIEDNEAGYPKRVYTSVDEKTYAAMLRSGWTEVSRQPEQK
jgi:hypothetical protein